MCCWSRTNVHLIERIYYKWQLVPQDPDDDKFVDYAILADVDYLVTNDLHFKMAKKNPFPAVNIINADDFCVSCSPKAWQSAIMAFIKPFLRVLMVILLLKFILKIKNMYRIYCSAKIGFF